MCPSIGGRYEDAPLIHGWNKRKQIALIKNYHQTLGKKVRRNKQYSVKTSVFHWFNPISNHLRTFVAN